MSIEGTDDEEVDETTVWREYQFKGKPGDPARRPSQIAPYHLRLDWLMWFAAMGSAQDEPWFSGLMLKLLEGDKEVARTAGRQPIPGSSAAMGSRPHVPLHLHHAGRAQGHRAVVEPHARG